MTRYRWLREIDFEFAFLQLVEPEKIAALGADVS
jgi:hypothetical protein